MVKNDLDLIDREIETDAQNDMKKAAINDESKDDEAKSEDSEEASWSMDPLVLTEDIVLKYHDFVDYMIQMLKLGKVEEELQLELQRWDEILERGKQLVEALNKRLKKVGREMECLKEEEYFHREYSLRKSNLYPILAQLRDITSRLETSPHIAVVSDIKKRENVLPLCFVELHKSKQELTIIIDGIKVLKQLDFQTDDDDDDDDDDETE